MSRAIAIGVVSGVGLAAWSVLTMFEPVPYWLWSLGRSVIYISFVVTLFGVCASIAREHSAWRAFGAAAVAPLMMAAPGLFAYAVTTTAFADRIVQLPEYAADYAFHGYRSPQAYLAQYGSALMRMQIF